MTEVEESAPTGNISAKLTRTPHEVLTAPAPRPSCSTEFRQRRRAPEPPEWTIKRILVPTNYSDASSNAIHRAISLANQREAVLTILHVIDVSAQAQPGLATDFVKRVWNEGSAEMASVALSLVRWVDAQTMIAEGLPWEVIVEKSTQFDLIVMADSNNKKGWKPFCKHTTRRVIENAACPVMVVRS